jgi:hypothetical protein
VAAVIVSISFAALMWRPPHKVLKVRNDMLQQHPDQVMQRWIQILHTGAMTQVKEALASAGVDVQEGLVRLQTVLDTHCLALTTCLRRGLHGEDVDTLNCDVQH